MFSLLYHLLCGPLPPQSVSIIILVKIIWHYSLSSVFYRAAALCSFLALSPSSLMSFLPPLTLHIILDSFDLVLSLVLPLYLLASNLKPNCPSELTQRLVTEHVPVCVRWEQVTPQGAAWPHCVTFTSVHIKLVCLSPWGSFKACVKCMDKQGRLPEEEIPIAEFSQLVELWLFLAAFFVYLDILLKSWIISWIATIQIGYKEYSDEIFFFFVKKHCA